MTPAQKVRNRRKRATGLSDRQLRALKGELLKEVNSCGICGRMFTPTIDRSQITLDHIVAAHSIPDKSLVNVRSNLQLAHRQCNQEKNTREQLDTIVLLPTTPPQKT